MVELRDGRLWMLIRTYRGCFTEAWSDDEGRTWKDVAPGKIGASGSPGQLRRLHSGRLVLFWNRFIDPAKRTGRREQLSMAFSEDDGPELPPKEEAEAIEFRLKADPGIVGRDGLVRLDVKLKNNTPAPLAGLTYMDVLEGDLEFVADPKGMVSYDEVSRTVSLYAEVIAPGAEAQFSYTLQLSKRALNSGKAQGELWVHTAEVTRRDGQPSLKAETEFWVGKASLAGFAHAGRVKKEGG